MIRDHFARKLASPRKTTIGVKIGKNVQNSLHQASDGRFSRVHFENVKMLKLNAQFNLTVS